MLGGGLLVSGDVYTKRIHASHFSQFTVTTNSVSCTNNYTYPDKQLMPKSVTKQEERCTVHIKHYSNR